MIAAAALPTVAKDMAVALKRGRLATALGIARGAALAPDLGAEKIVSKRHRYVWFCVPKAASRSIMAALRELTRDAEVFSGLSAAQVFALRPAARRYFRFAFVRHPFTRALSFHAELHAFGDHYQGSHKLPRKEEKRAWLCRRFHGLADTAAFDDYCRWLLTPYAADAVADRHFLSQHAQLAADDGRPLDFIGHFERLDQDFREVATQLGLATAALPMLNTMAGWQGAPAALAAARSRMERHLTPANKALLATRYAEDLVLARLPAGQHP